MRVNNVLPGGLVLIGAVTVNGIFFRDVFCDGVGDLCENLSGRSLIHSLVVVFDLVGLLVGVSLLDTVILLVLLAGRVHGGDGM